ncbi:MAG: phosphate transport system regulatory protein PhoU [Proteobacteria bacterium]|nr:phosphate transport system regulatory protein PhoU [Pseudomonadota bacterium]
MTRHLLREVENLKKMILGLSAQVEGMLFKAVRAVAERNAALAEEVQSSDEEIDRNEVEVEEECLKILALHQPVAIDLRFIIAVLKINSDLERIADLAVNIAARAGSLSRLPQVQAPVDYHSMADQVKGMLQRALQALVKLDAVVAREVLRADDEIDCMHREMFATLGARIKNDPASADTYIHYLSVSRNLERIADHTTNIAEDVIYMVDGEIVRHRARG